MNEYIFPIKYQNVGCGITVVIAGLENSYQYYKGFKLSINGEDFIDTTIDVDNLDFTYPVTFDNLYDNSFYTIYGKLVLKDDSCVNIQSKIAPQINSEIDVMPLGLFMFPEMKIKLYPSGVLISNNMMNDTLKASEA